MAEARRAAIQRLDRKLQEKLKDKENEIQGLRERIADLEKIVAKLANSPK
jgi:polyhydroxyalkanoate synthesis regulator phasin